MASGLPQARTKKRAIQMDARWLCLGPERLDRPGMAHLAPWVAGAGRILRRRRRFPELLPNRDPFA